MILFLKLLLAHLLGDFLFQPESWVKDKEDKKITSSKLYLHIGIHLILLFILLGFNLKEYWVGVFVIIPTHYLIDLLKLYSQKKNTKRIWFFIDQLLHSIILIFVAFYYSKNTFSIENLMTEKNLLLIVCLLFVTHVSAVFVKAIITQWNPEGKVKKDESLAKAGRYIGILERLLIFIFIINNHWEAVGFLLAAKSIFRFGDLTDSEDRKLTEYILIGTLLSFGSAILTGILYEYLVAII